MYPGQAWYPALALAGAVSFTLVTPSYHPCAPQAEARVAADIQAEMAMGAVPGMPVSSTRKLLEMQYRKEMKMKMAHDMNAPPGMHFEPGMPPLGPLSQGQLGEHLMQPG